MVSQFAFHSWMVALPIVSSKSRRQSRKRKLMPPWRPHPRKDPWRVFLDMRLSLWSARITQMILVARSLMPSQRRSLMEHWSRYTLGMTTKLVTRSEWQSSAISLLLKISPAQNRLLYTSKGYVMHVWCFFIAIDASSRYWRGVPIIQTCRKSDTR